MMITQEDIKKVLAMFDEEDIPYVLSDWILKRMLPSEKDTSSNNKIKIKGDKNDRRREQ